MSRILRTKDGSSIDLVGVGVIVILCVTIAFIVQQVAPIVSLYKHPPKEATGTRDNAESARKYADTLAWDRDQIKNRSLFFIPPKPEEGPPTITATKYEGPSLSMFVNGTAFFSDGQKVSAAEPDAKTLHFVRADPPWSVRVKWKNKEFDVPIFEKIQLSSLTSSLAGSFPTSGSSHSSTPGSSTPDKPGGATTGDGKSNPPTETPQPPPPVTNSGGNGPGGGETPPPPPPPPAGGAPGGPSGPPQGEPPSPPPSGSPPSSPSPAPAPANPSNGSTPAPSPSDPAHPSDHR